MSDPDESTVLQWLDLEADGCLSDAERERLENALEANPAYRQDLEGLRHLHQELRAMRIEARPGFVDEVMESLPVAAWESTGRQGWGVAAAVAGALAVLSALLFGLGGAAPSGAGAVFGIVAAIGQMLQATFVTGAGLLGASWRGVGLALQEILSVSPVTTVVFGAAVLAINLLFFRLLRRDVRASQLTGRGEAPPRSSGHDQ